MKILSIIKNLIVGFWTNGFVSLCQVVIEQWILSIFVIVLIAYLCSDPETAIYAWVLIAVFAIYSAINAIIDIFIEIKNYIKDENIEYKTLVVQRIGGKIFDLALCIVGIFQALKIFSHISKITKSASSAINVVDDVAGAISKFLENLRK